MTTAATPPTRDIALDGMRGFALLLVVLYHTTMFARAAQQPLYHALVSPLQVGWWGVDYFFVMSGFLITRILLRERESPRYFRSFYGRRMLRVFPLYYAILALFFGVVPALDSVLTGLDFWHADVVREPIWYWLYLSNFHDAAAGEFHHHFLSIAWSLAIEEQFYLVWPLLVWKLRMQTLKRVCGGAILAALLLRIYFTVDGLNPLALYIATPFRMDTLAVGAWLALRVREDGGITSLLEMSRRALPVLFLAFASLSTLLLAHPTLLGSPPGRFLLANPVMQTVGYSLSAAFSGFLVVRLVGAPMGWLARTFSARWLIALGKYSYAMYLLHSPVNWAMTRFLVNPRDLGWPFVAEQLLRYVLVVSLTFMAALLSWRLIERPAQRFRKHFRY